MIEVENLNKSYGTTQAVRNLSFTVNKGDVLGFLGPNGAGKSTTMKILTCYLPADSGSVRVAGFDVYTESIEIRRRIGYLPENNPLYLDMGVMEFLRYIARMRKIPGRQVRSKIKQVVERCRLESIISKDIAELSKGFRQRLGLAQALIHDPDVLILDEPTIGLDPHQIVEIRNLIKAIGREKTVILSSHILPEVSATCDRVLILNRGEIVGSGSPQDLASMAQGGQKIITSIRGPLEAVLSELQKLKKVSKIKHAGGEQDVNHFELLAETGDEVSEQIFYKVAENRWSLTELHKKSINLEDVFLDLTTREDAR